MREAVVSRQDLSDLERSCYFIDLERSGRVSDGPDSARTRILQQCGSVPDLFGDGCPPFDLLRSLISAPLKEAGLLDAVSISAPHSHWGPCAVLHRWNQIDRYFEVGALRDVPTSNSLLPVSFVFSDNGLLPVEWCEVCGDLGGADYLQTLRVLSELNFAARRLERNGGFCCFGLALNFRFKSLRERPLFPTIEAPCDDRPTATVRIDTSANYSDRASNSQVAWLLRRVRALSDAQLEVLSFMSQRLSQLEPDVAREVFAALISESPHECEQGSIASRGGA